MVLIEAVSLAFSYPTSPDALFDDLGFSIHSDSRIGLVGQNGSGKSTLLRLLRGSLEPQAGKLLSARGLEIGWLPQDSGEAWEEGPEKAAPFSEGGFRRIAVSLDLDPGIREKPFRSLSGGEKTKLALARLLAAEPGFLLLDEPTNYLDSASRAAAAKLLAAGETPYLVVSHDRRFLDETVSEIWELREGRVAVYAGNYSFYRVERELDYRKRLAVHERTKAEIGRLAEAARHKKNIASRIEAWKPARSVKKNGGVCQRDAGSGKAGLRVGNAMRGAANLEARLERLASSGEARRPEDLLSRRIRIDRLDEGGNRRVLSVQGLATGYEGRLVFSGLGFDLFRGERLTLRGKNGSGKTTLFRVLLGEIPPAEGSFLIPPSVRVAYFAQKLEHLGTEASLLEAVLGGDLSLQTKARHILADFGLTGDSVFRKVSEASAGERSKTALAAVLFSRPDLFLLDEPTNHLEPEALEALETAFREFSGGMIYASHDRMFVERTATRELNMEDYFRA